MTKAYPLPGEARQLIHARNMLRERFSAFGLKFTPDGNLVGDLGEAVAAELFELRLVVKAGHKGVDGYDRDNRAVQIKATGRGKSFSFIHTDTRADRLIALVFDYDRELVKVVYNGSHHDAVARLPPYWSGQKTVTVSTLRRISNGL